MNKRIEDALNLQINRELFSEYLYLSMAAWFAAEGLNGFENFFIVQAQEERFHAMKLYRYINERGGRVILKKLEEPKTDFSGIHQIFELSLEHEKFITKSINGLMDLAITENDHATKSLLNWYVDEQVEEESSMQAVLDKLKYIGETGQGILILDGEFAARQFNLPAENQN
jgi:ferritin